MNIVNRMIRAARLDVSLYEEVEKDVTATNEAVLVVVIASICAGIGMAIGGQMAGGLGGLVFWLAVGAITALIGWFVWSFITYFIGTRVFKGPKTESSYGELLRCIGFSSSPGVLRILSFIPIVGAIIAYKNEYLDGIANSIRSNGNIQSSTLFFNIDIHLHFSR